MTIPTSPSKALCTARLFGWFLGSLLLAAGLGWLASEVSGAWSPLVLFSLLLGGVLGGMLVVLMRNVQVHHAGVVYPLAILAVALVVVSQHWFAYREAVRAVDEDIRLLQKARFQLPNQFQGQIPTLPTDLLTFLCEEAGRPRTISTFFFGEIKLQGTKTWAFWGIDALLVLLPTLLLLVNGRRARAWCPTCRSWYHVIRKGRLDIATAEALLASLKRAGPIQPENEQPDSAKAAEDKNKRFATYLISDCDGRCGKAELVVLIPAKSVFETHHLDRNQLRAVETIL